MMRARDEEARRRDWRWLWLTTLQAFADAEVQRQRWTDRHERNPHYSFVECMCGYFDDALWGEKDPYEHRASVGWLSHEEVAAVARFHAAAETYRPPDGNDYAVSAILADDEWQDVVRLAREAQRELLMLLTDPTERAALTQPIEWTERDGIYHVQRPGVT